MTPSERFFIKTAVGLLLLTALRAAERKTTFSPDTTQPDPRPRADSFRARTRRRPRPGKDDSDGR